MNPHIPIRDDPLWQALVRAEQSYYAARTALVHAANVGSVDTLTVLTRALRNPSERGTALRLLIDLDERVRRQLFPVLVQLAAVEHSDVQLVRATIRSLDAAWVEKHVGQQVEHILRRSATYEEYRRLAELLDALHSTYLKTLVSKAAKSSDVDIREVAEDFVGR